MDETCPDHGDEIEVTEEMIEAGVSAFSGFNPDFELIDTRLADVYRAMEAARTDWRPIETAPRKVPVKVYASLDPSDPLMTWREFTAVDHHGLGWWKQLGRRGLRVYPTHWAPLREPPTSPE